MGSSSCVHEHALARLVVATSPAIFRDVIEYKDEMQQRLDLKNLSHLSQPGFVRKLKLRKNETG